MGLFSPVGATAKNSAAASTTLQLSITVNSGEDMIEVGIGSPTSGDASTVKLDVSGTDFSLVTSIAGTGIYGQRWRLYGVSAGAHTIDITFGSSRDIVAVAQSGVGVHQSAGEGTAVTSTGSSTTPASATATSADTEYVSFVLVTTAGAADLAHRSEDSWVADRIQINNSCSIVVGYRRGAGSASANWTIGSSRNYATIATPIKPASGNTLGIVPAAFRTTVIAADATTGHTVNLPGAVSGDDCVVVVSFDGNPTFSNITAGWTTLKDLASGSVVKLLILTRRMDGGEGATITFDTSTSERGVITAMRFTNVHATSAIEASTGASGSSTTPDPDSLTPSWGSADQLYLAPTGNDGNVTISAYPTSFVPVQFVTNSNANGTSLGMAMRPVAASTVLDPGTYTLSGAEDWATATVASRPAAVAAAAVVADTSYYIPSVRVGW